jgi:hypothetical protein
MDTAVKRRVDKLWQRLDILSDPKEQGPAG